MSILSRRHRTSGARPFADIGAASAVGGRRDNQDRSAVADRWAAVSDGIGGYAGGARAAELTLDAVTSVLGHLDTEPLAPDKLDGLVLEAVRRANDDVRAARADDPTLANMGATVTLAAAVGPTSWLVANVGDSPAWLVRADATSLLTEEHTLAAQLVRDGSIPSEAALGHPGRHVLTRSIGLEDVAVAAVRLVEVAPDEILVLASDGLGGGLDPSGLHRMLAPSGRSAQDQATGLVDAAVAGGATDNVTVVVIRPGTAPAGTPNK
jgi:serine/threonine protein phosphatase PrpC